MIWIRGEVLPDEAVKIGILDRTFEHGLGLFETFRTWNGHPTLLHRHIDRMRGSARELGLALDPDDLPDAEAVWQLVATRPESHGSEESRGDVERQAGSDDVRLRVVLSGGGAAGPREARRSTLWMTASPLPPPMQGGARIVRSILVDPDDPLTRHKTLNYWRRRIEQARAAGEGADEVLCITPDGRICEGTRSNLFLVRDGSLITPGADGPLLDGIMRRVVIERARRRGIPVIEDSLRLDEVNTPDEAFLTNSVRGILPVARLLHADLPAPGPVSRRLWDDIVLWLNSGGTTT